MTYLQDTTTAQASPHTKFIDAWFQIYKDALSDLGMTRGHTELRKDEDGNEALVWVGPTFGMSRIPRMSGHDLSTSTEYIGDRKKLSALLKNAPYYAHVWGFGAGTDVVSKENLRLKFREYVFPANEPRVEGADAAVIAQFARDSLEPLAKGEVPKMTLRDWDIEARLLRLSDKACLKCHSGNKLNDPVAVFVFATLPR